MKFPAAIVAAILASAPVVPAAVVFVQPPDPAGGQTKSAWYAPDGMDGDAWAWDNFTLAATQSFNQVAWRGAYTHYLSGAGKSPVYDFTVAIYPSIAAGIQPDVVNGPLVEYRVGSNANETPAGTFGGVQMYDYSFTLPTAFQAIGGTKYWVQIEAWQGLTPQYYWPPDWSIAFAAPGSGNGAHFYALRGSTEAVNYSSRSRDLAFSLASVPPTVNAVWDFDGDGDWSETGNWLNNAAPNGPDHSATFGPVITAPRTVTVNMPRSVGTITFNAAAGYLLGGTATLTLNATTGPAAIHVSNGSHAIAAPIALAADVTINVNSPLSTLAISGDVSSAGRTITKAGDGALEMKAVRAAGLDVQSGELRLSTKAATLDPAGTSVLNSLTIGAGWIDLDNNGLIVDYDAPGSSVPADVRGYVVSGALWASTIDPAQALGYADNAVLGLSAFGGRAVDATSVLVVRTIVGDANLDRVANIGDFSLLAAHFNAPGDWVDGDFDYDGNVAIGDFALLAANFNAADPARAAPAPVPEPAAAGWLIVAVAAAGTGYRSHRRGARGGAA